MRENGRNEKELPWVTWNPHFRESENVDAFSSCILDDFDSLVDGSLEIQPDGLSLDCSQSDCLFRHYCR